MTGMAEDSAMSPEGYTNEIRLTGAVSVLLYKVGPPRIRHHCKVVDGQALIVAPKLSGRHTVVAWEPLSIVPSILCPDCGLHGYVTNGTWVPVR